MTKTQAHHAGTYDGWHEAEFVATYGEASAAAAPQFADDKIAKRYADGVAKGQERHAAGLEVNGGKRVGSW